ncbi:heparinase II/III family protein [Kribbella albertanoniae]|uniref:Heparinase n=1 Tax=Kribbella albertanoniae TaxID=1266829 RepID=A0A4R4PM18_9ACTN|nr:heparinase II/III family protein [Kribbella albertanoniae]TDC23152.1 heparinase [Kribbella albertanoniae]
MSLASRWAALSPAIRQAAVDSARDRVGVPDLLDRSLWESRPALAVLAQAAEDRGQPWPRLLLSDYARYWRDGVRTAYENPAGELRRRTSTAVLAAVLTADERYVDEAADGLLLLCEQTTWCWAAHESFATARGEVVADSPYLDLGAAETVEILAWADLVLGPALDDRVPGLRRRLREEADRRVLRPFLEDRRWHWLGLDGHLHNWNPWIHGHVLVAALFLETDVVRRMQVVDLVVDGLDRYLGALPADGGCDEGFAYWWNGPARLASALEVLDRITLGALDPWTVEPMPELARYPQRMALGDGWYVNVGDGSARPSPDQPWDVLHRWGRRTGDREVMAQAAAHRDQSTAAVVGLGRALVALVDDDWLQAAVVPLPLPRSSWLPDVQLLVARQSGGSAEGWALAVKGGHNDENHNHNDVGSFIAALDAVPVLMDLGQPTYTAISFSDRRYEQWVVRSEWHNVPVVDGREQEAGSQWRAADFAVRGSSEASLDLSTAYPGGKLRRTVTLDRRAAAIRVVDTGTSFEEHFVIAGHPVAHEPGRLVVETLGGSVAELHWDSALGTGQLEKRVVDDAMLLRVWGPAVHRLIIAGSNNRFELTMTRGHR